MKETALKIIKFYQNFISLAFGPNCRFWPSCSEYTSRAIKKYGLKKGLFLFTRRIIRCHPWHQGGIDLP